MSVLVCNIQDAIVAFCQLVFQVSFSCAVGRGRRFYLSRVLEVLVGLRLLGQTLEVWKPPRTLARIQTMATPPPGLDGFPSEIHEQIVGCLDWRGLFSLGACSVRFHRLICRGDESANGLWRLRLAAKWRNGRLSVGPDAENEEEVWLRRRGWYGRSPEDNLRHTPSGSVDWFQEFRRRLLLDETVPGRLGELVIDRSSGNETWHGLMRDGPDIIDELGRGRSELGTLLRKKCDVVLVGIARFTAYARWRRINEDDASDARLEDGALAISSFYSSAESIYQAYSAETDSFLHRKKVKVYHELDRSTELVTSLLQLGPKPEIEGRHSILQVLEGMKLLFKPHADSNSFTGNFDDYYNPSNSLIDRVTATKKGIPITLAIVYAAVVRRVTDGGLGMDIIGLPGHIVVGVPTNLTGSDPGDRIFVDPFNGGSILSYADCQAIVGRYGITFHEDMTRPLAEREVWQRQIRNLVHCHSMQAMEDDERGYRREGDLGALEWRIAVPLRYFLSDWMDRATSLRELCDAPGWCPKFC